jgi:hypothetical protein
MIPRAKMQGSKAAVECATVNTDMRDSGQRTLREGGVRNGRSQSSVKEEERGHFSAGLLGPGIPHPLLWASTGLWAAATKQLSRLRSVSSLSACAGALSASLQLLHERFGQTSSWKQALKDHANMLRLHSRASSSGAVRGRIRASCSISAEEGPCIRMEERDTAHICAGTGLTPDTSAPGLAHTHLAGTGLAAATSTPGLGSPRPQMQLLLYARQLSGVSTSQTSGGMESSSSGDTGIHT